MISLMCSHKLQNLNSMHFRHIQIKNHEIHSHQSQALDSFKSATGFTESHTSQPLQRRHHHSPHGWRIVNNQDVRSLGFRVRHRLDQQPSWQKDQ